MPRTVSKKKAKNVHVKEDEKKQGEESSSAEPKSHDLKTHPLLLPSVFAVLLNHLHYEDVHRCSQVCRAWNRIICTNANPFLNPRILSSLVSFIPASSLLQCRLVCSLWNASIIKSSRWRGTELEDGGELDYSTFFKGGYQGLGATDFDRFREKFGVPSELPLELGFSRLNLPNNISLGDPSTSDFLKDYGSIIKSLQLYRCKWDLEDLRQVLFEQAPNLENFHLVCGIIPGTQTQPARGGGRTRGRGKKRAQLAAVIPELDVILHEDPANIPVLSHMKSLALDLNLMDSKDKPRPYAEQFLAELISNCPNLEILNVDISSWYTRTWVTDFLATRDDIPMNKLKVIQHIIDPDNAQIINLQLKQLPLTTLKIRIRFRDITLESLHELLISLKHTLTFLQIIFMEFKNCAHEFPSSQDLYKLKRLELWKFKGQLDFLKDFISLESLLLGEMELKGQALFNQRDMFKVLLPNLKQLEFKDYWETRLFS